ncbi:hypothetical protein [Limosilactobacillus reuteri]|jgi:hypothetical protein|uniref:Uncharacterized protein n=2 Tax=Limosilactobacillus reuteri TaxID=1598 RepID=S5NEF3_LIMRT|nr:hypothetical protein [Limosilactobacillus reuteri]AGR65398.1 hypothetical protein N134_09105 [Limosilactobacillus reuteri TD1]QDR73280.1 hypothetical protein FOD75_09480 [Limosilactobacillus reuteri]TGY50039.1 hypothetical protein E5338_00075 [Limosilactobacillus reuteri]
MNKIMSKKVLMLSIVLAVMILGLNVNQSNVHVAANTDTISQHLSTLNNQHETAESETVVSYSKDNQQCAVVNYINCYCFGWSGAQQFWQVNGYY